MTCGSFKNPLCPSLIQRAYTGKSESTQESVFLKLLGYIMYVQDWEPPQLYLLFLQLWCFRQQSLPECSSPSVLAGSRTMEALANLPSEQSFPMPAVDSPGGTYNTLVLGLTPETLMYLAWDGPWLQLCLPKKVCWSANPQYLLIWPNLEMASLKR